MTKCKVSSIAFLKSPDIGKFIIASSGIVTTLPLATLESLSIASIFCCLV